MSSRLAKLKRRAARAEAGISKQAERGQREFEDAVARLRMRGILRAQEPIQSLEPKRKRLAWVGLAVVAVILGWVLGGLLFEALR